MSIDRQDGRRKCRQGDLSVGDRAVDQSASVCVVPVSQTATRTAFMFKFIGGTIGVIFLIGLLVVIGLLSLIF